MAGAEGSSLVAAVLEAVQSPSGRLEKEGLGGRISRLSDRVEELKDEVCNMINQRYVEFLPSMQSAKDLESEAEELFSSIDQLKSVIETEVQQDLNVAIAEFTELKQQLERDTLVLSVLKQLQEIDSALKQSSVLLLEKKYVPAACHLRKAQKCLKIMESRRGFELKILKALHVELVAQTQNILGVLAQEWQQLAVWKLPESKETGSLESALQTELRLCKALPREDADGSPSATSVLWGFAVLGELHYRFKVFGQLLLNYILKPLVCHPSLQSLLEEQSDAVVLRLKSAGAQPGPASPMEVFAKLRLVLEVLHKHLLVSPDHCTEDESNAKPVLAEVLGEVIWKELSDCLTNDCLVHSIPKSSSKLGQYIEVIKATEEFEQALKDMQFLKEDSTDLLTYARNVNRHFADKKCQDVIVTARNLMMSEIHNTVKVTPESSVALPKLPDPAAGDQASMLMAASKVLSIQAGDLETKTRLSQHTLSFPACCISTSIQQLMALAYQTLEEASASADQYSAQLFYLVRNIFYLFCDVVPMYHRENLQKLPQLAAIHHNNCMYIAHHLLTLGHQFQGRLRGLLCDGTATFVDLVPVFRRLGTECFLAQMQVQKGELLERLSSARDFSTVDDEDSYAAANKAVRQVLHQLKRLGKIWQDILPASVYCKAMGTLLNTALTEIINRILALEDISAENADRLYELCQIMVREGPQVFVPLSEEKQNRTFQEEVPLYVPKWMMFKELMLVLQASLQEIMDRWADSKGPLAAEFSSGEVKNLIRALFQNTERRAAALAKI